MAVHDIPTRLKCRDQDEADACWLSCVITVWYRPRFINHEGVGFCNYPSAVCNYLKHEGIVQSLEQERRRAQKDEGPGS